MLRVMELVCKKDEMPKLFLKKAEKHSEILLNRFAHIFSGQLRDDIIKKEISSNYDVIETGHFHDGWVPTKILDKN